MKASPLRGRAFGVAALLGLAACSSPPPPKDTTPVATAAPVAEAPKPDLSPVAAPLGLVAKARGKNLGATMRVLATVGRGDPNAVEQVSKLLVTELLTSRRALRLDVDAKALADQVAFDAPADLVVVMGESGKLEAKVAWSLGLKSLEGARAAAGEKATEIGAGTWAIKGEKAKGSCVITHAAGPVAARLVCSTHPEGAAQLAPYLVRTMAVEPPPAADVVADVDVAALDAQFGEDLRKILPALPMLAKQQLGIGNETFDAALQDGAKLLGREAGLLVGDVERLSLEGRIDPAGSVDLELTTSFRGDKSWLTKTAFSTPAAPPPALFWRGPKDATSALYTTVGDPASYAEILGVIKGLVVGALAEQKMGSDGERKKLAALFDFPLTKGATLVAFSGHGKVAAAAAPKTPKEKWQRGFDAMSGWSMMALGQKPDLVTKWLKDGVAALNQKGVQGALKKETGGEIAITAKSGQAPAKLGKGASAFELKLSNPKIKAEGTLSVLVVPDGETTWIASGFDANDLAERLLRAKAGTDTLKDRADLAPVRQGDSVTGYFFSTRTFASGSLVGMLAPIDPASKTKPEDRMLEMTGKMDQFFASLPGKGTAPAFLVATTTADKKQMRLRVTLPKAALDDLAAAGQGMQPSAPPPPPPSIPRMVPPPPPPAPAPKKN